MVTSDNTTKHITIHFNKTQNVPFVSVKVTLILNYWVQMALLNIGLKQKRLQVLQSVMKSAYTLGNTIIIHLRLKAT